MMKTCLLMLLLLQTALVQAHHILGRPSYALNEDSNTPPSMQVEVQIGDYFVNYMVYPAFPRANEPGRIHFYASHLQTSQQFDGKVTFSARDDGWLSDGRAETLGVQVINDTVYRQDFLFQEEGDYLISASFEANGEPYNIDFPLRIGEITAIGPIGLLAGSMALALIGVNLWQRKRLLRNRLRNAHEEQSS